MLPDATIAGHASPCLGDARQNILMLVKVDTEVFVVCDPFEGAGGNAECGVRGVVADHNEFCLLEVEIEASIIRMLLECCENRLGIGGGGKT